jgi:hypothetical protein
MLFARASSCVGHPTKSRHHDEIRTVLRSRMDASDAPNHRGKLLRRIKIIDTHSTFSVAVAVTNSEKQQQNNAALQYLDKTIIHHVPFRRRSFATSLCSVYIISILATCFQATVRNNGHSRVKRRGYTALFRIMGPSHLLLAVYFSLYLSFLTQPEHCWRL